MTIAIWIVQVLTGLAFVLAAYSHGFRADQMKAQPGGQWVAAVPRGLLSLAVVCEVLGGVGVILPAATGILPWLTRLPPAVWR